MSDTLVEQWVGIKNRISDIFHPSEIASLARDTKFIQRCTSRLRGLEFVELMTTTSMDPEAVPLEGLCAALRKNHPNADLTPQSLMERINRPEAASFLKAIFELALKKALKCTLEHVPADLLKSFNRVLIEDCSECALHEALQKDFKGSSGGASKASVRLDLIYEIAQLNIINVELTDRRCPDSKLAKANLHMVEKGDLWIRDLGFFDGSVLKQLGEKGAYFLSRLPSSVHVYLDKEDKHPVDLARHINIHYPYDAVVDLKVFITVEKLPCRLVAYRAPQEVAEKRRREAHKEAIKKGRTQKQTNIDRLDFTFFITNVSKEIWGAEVVGTVYTVRWQAELTFKIWKSSLKIHYLKGTNPDRIRCLLYGKLILIVMMNLIYKFAARRAQALGREISQHKVVNWLKVDSKLAIVVSKGFGRAFFDLLIKEIPKTLSKAKRNRKTTEEALEKGIHYCDLYECLKIENGENQGVKVA